MEETKRSQSFTLRPKGRGFSDSVIINKTNASIMPSLVFSFMEVNPGFSINTKAKDKYTYGDCFGPVVFTGRFWALWVLFYTPIQSSPG